jgi:hypothetical protein
VYGKRCPAGVKCAATGGMETMRDESAQARMDAGTLR